MARSKPELTEFNTLDQALQLCNVEELKKLAAVIPIDTRGIRKEGLVSEMSRHLTDAGHLRNLWRKLDSLQQKAVSDTLYSEEGSFDGGRFEARHGSLPEFDVKVEGRYRGDPTPLRLLIHSLRGYGYWDGMRIPDDLKEPLRTFVPRPDPDRLDVIDSLPESFEQVIQQYDYSSDPVDFRSGGSPRAPKVRKTVRRFPLERRDTERAALNEVVTVMRAVDRGKLAVSEATSKPSATTMEEVGALLRDGDFYGSEPGLSKDDRPIGSIRAFAWPLILQAGKLVKINRSKLALTKVGRQALAAHAADTLRLLWRQWLASGLLDEFSRVDVIKGQQGSGKRNLTSPKDRRAAIHVALKRCPVGKWLEFDEFSRFMIAVGIDFDVTLNPYDLYIADRQYGHLGYDGSHAWNILQERYMLCFLFEYAATLGMIDVAYVTPRGTRADFSGMWGTDDLDFLSRYDGLRYFRLNPLGAYCLGLTDRYTPTQPESRVVLTVLPNLSIQVSGDLSPEEKLLLETYAESESADLWRLNRDKMLSTVENGGSLDELRRFLQARDEQELPGPVTALLTLAERNGRALKTQGPAFLIECSHTEIAELLATHDRSRRLCQRAGDRHVVIRASDEAAFRKAAHLLGYGMPPA